MKYRFGLDVGGLVLFLLVIIPTIVWSFFPAPNDILRAESATPLLDAVALVLQILAVTCLCVVINKNAGKFRLSPLVFLTVLCVLIYYTGWVLYYCGFSNPLVILLLSLPPCLALILFAADRKNMPAGLLASAFAVCHLIFALANFILK